MVIAADASELALNEGLGGVMLTHLRPCSFYSNLLSYLPMIKNAGFVVSNYGPATQQVFGAPSDIAAIATAELTSLSGLAVHYIASDERPAAHIARVMGTAIGCPALP